LHSPSSVVIFFKGDKKIKNLEIKKINKQEKKINNSLFKIIFRNAIRITVRIIFRNVIRIFGVIDVEKVFTFGIRVSILLV
jgi:hypothetical protein